MDIRNNVIVLINNSTIKKFKSINYVNPNEDIRVLIMKYFFERFNNER